MRRFFLTLLLFAISESCFQVRRFNECGCVDYKSLSRAHIAQLNPQLSKDISNGNLTNPIFIYENCSYIHMECDPESGETRQLLRTNWPENQIIYTVNMNQFPRTSALWFNVKCDQKTHEWKYSEVDNDREIVTESVICLSI
ncbi:hypothetical protein GCK72_001934 [Caenorhabditis remanei]|uniref:Uncharacterized protein n=1 Tax=Caenorhabditis remanei TaxID=31234 RepID=A0A6A5HTM6_CAERE|nr:hypothetical protein GCK72_001934 [Caenorhabditis remanei]KAF1770116.1 hypothetical protein GCK72_001934 [Caenorhabditis remanei]